MWKDKVNILRYLSGLGRMGNNPPDPLIGIDPIKIDPIPIVWVNHWNAYHSPDIFQSALCRIGNSPPDPLIGIERKEGIVLFNDTLNTLYYGYMASDIWLRTILIVRKETRYSFQLAARVLLYAPSHRQDNIYHGLCYTSRGALAGTTKAQDRDWYNRIWCKMHCES